MKELISDYGANPTIAWLANFYVWFTSGMSPLAALLAIVTLWFTWEKIRTERANRKIINQKLDTLEKQMNTNYQDL